ncbi:MAG: hypothetical protein RIT45_2480 [Pseudomonadota bacterium]
MSRFHRLLRGVGCFVALGFVAGCSRSTPKSDAPVVVSETAAGATAAAKAEAAAPSSTRAMGKVPRPKMRPAGGAIAGAADWRALKAQVQAHPAAEGARVAARARSPQQRRAALRAAPHAPVPPGAPASGFRLSYAPTEDAVAQAFQRAFRQERVLEGVVAQLNASLRIRGSIEIELAGCGEANAFYDDGRGDAEPAEADQAAEPPSAPTSPRITLCHELITEFVQLFADEDEDPAELRAQVVGAVYFTLFHELGHALRDNLQLAVVGREEDAVDQLATLLLLRLGDAGVDAALAAANAFALEQAEEDESDEAPDLWDEHSMSGQRMYDMLCLIYGSNPKAFENLVGEDGVPEERAEQCPETYAQVLSAWDRLLGPHLAKTSTLKVVLPPMGAVSAAAEVPAKAGAPVANPEGGASETE